MEAKRGSAECAELTETSLIDELLEASDVREDEEQVVIEAKKNIVIRCGKASITLTKDGRIILRGEYVLSAATGMNLIKGGAVEIN
jgi:hypothetical protein